MCKNCNNNSCNSCAKPIVRYTGPDLECINVRKGDNYDLALAKINALLCDLESNPAIAEGTRIEVTDLAPGEDCENGGIVFNVYDIATEDLISSNTICNAPDGTRVEVVDLDPGEICENGGLTINVYDSITDELLSTNNVCNGTGSEPTPVELPFVTPEMFGAEGDGVTDDSAAIQDAFDTGRPVYLYGEKVYKVDSTITLVTESYINGNGATLKTDTPIDIFSVAVGADFINIHNIIFEGELSGANETGIRIVGPSDLSATVKDIQISNCRFLTLTTGIFSRYNGTTLKYGTSRVSDCYAEGCTTGFLNNTRSEYNTYENCSAVNCGTGWENHGGNNCWIGGNISSNNLGVHIINDGPNDGHGCVVGTMINHNSAAVRVSDSVFGFQFIGCQIYENNSIQVIFGDQVEFIGCSISVLALQLNNATNCSFKTCKFVITPAIGITLPPSGQKPRMIDCSFVTAKPFDPSLAIDTDTVSTTATSLNIANIDTIYTFTGGSAATWIFGAVANNIGIRHIFINQGTASLTVQSSELNKIFESNVAVNSITLNPGETAVFFNNSSYFTLIQ